MPNTLYVDKYNLAVVRINADLLDNERGATVKDYLA
jgi:hypothetical protein